MVDDPAKHAVVPRMMMNASRTATSTWRSGDDRRRRCLARRAVATFVSAAQVASPRSLSARTICSLIGLKHRAPPFLVRDVSCVVRLARLCSVQNIPGTGRLQYHSPLFQFLKVFPVLRVCDHPRISSSTSVAVFASTSNPGDKIVAPPSPDRIATLLRPPNVAPERPPPTSSWTAMPGLRRPEGARAANCCSWVRAEDHDADGATGSKPQRGLHCQSDDTAFSDGPSFHGYFIGRDDEGGAEELD